MDNREKEGKMEIQKFKYLKNKNSFLDEIKSIFHSFWRAILCWKKLRIVDTSILRKLTKSKTDFYLPKSCFVCFLLKIMKNAFYFKLKALLVLGIFTFLMWRFDYLEKWLDKKSNVNYKIYVRGCTTNNYIQYTYYPISQDVKATRQTNLASW